VVLWDEVAYPQCPVCDLPVDWVDLALPVWCCAGCDAMLTVSTALRSARIVRIVRRLDGLEHIQYDVHLSVRPRT
jgi:hypothetical protein